MRRTVVVLATAAAFILGAAGPAAAKGPPQPYDKDCRIGTMCNTSYHWGWTGDVPERRNVGG